MKKQIHAPILLVALLLCTGIMAGNPEKPQTEISETKTKTEVQTTKAERPLVTSFFGGMMLTKIKLESQSSLVPYAHKDDADYAERCESLMGLVVFHTADKTDKSDKTMPSGMYVWDGEIWQQASMEYRRARVDIQK